MTSVYVRTVGDFTLLMEGRKVLMLKIEEGVLIKPNNQELQTYSWTAIKDFNHRNEIYVLRARTNLATTYIVVSHEGELLNDWVN